MAYIFVTIPTDLLMISSKKTTRQGNQREQAYQLDPENQTRIENNLINRMSSYEQVNEQRYGEQSETEVIPLHSPAGIQEDVVETEKQVKKNERERY